MRGELTVKGEQMLEKDDEEKKFRREEHHGPPPETAKRLALSGNCDQ